jgi:3-oxoacyl-[acyl-carrier-protein] synthase II
MKMYIRAAASISAQKTFATDDFLTHIIEYNATRLPTIEPDYTRFIDFKTLRRMSHIIKMGVASAKQCMHQSGIAMPGAIITGSGYGCMEDTVTFLTNIVEMEEQMIPPTAFIQSTHNTVAAQVALTLKCHNYNNTFVHKGISFESALFDAQMLLNEGEADNILVGGVDEMSDTGFTVLSRLGLYKRWPLSNLHLFKTRTSGTVCGEGSAFFLLSDKPSDDNLAELTALRMYFKPNNNAEIENQIIKLLMDNDLQITDIDLIITGRNGDTRNDKVYNELNTSLFKNKAVANYKHLCGDYPTSTAFALWLASNMVNKGTVPDMVMEEGAIAPASPKRVLIYNHYQGKYHSLMLVSKA